MLPAWAAIAIALGGSALGAFSGGFAAYLTLKASQLNITHEEAEAWRTRLIEASQDFLSVCGPTLIKLDDLTGDRIPDTGKGVDEAWELRDRAQVLAYRVGLLFGASSDTNKAADTLLDRLTDGIAEVEAGQKEKGYETWHLASAAQTDFIHAANAAIQGVRSQPEVRSSTGLPPGAVPL